MASLSSSSASSTSSSHALSLVQQKATTSDLLIRSDQLSFNAWAEQLHQKKDDAFQKKLVGSQIVAWQFCVMKKKQLPDAKLPSDVFSIIRSFVGDVKLRTPRIINKFYLQALSNKQRARDFKRIADKICELAEEAAKKGAATFLITEEVFASMSALPDGSRAHIGSILEVLEGRGITEVQDRMGYFYNEDELFDEGDGFPYRMIFNGRASANHVGFSRSFVDDLENSRGMFSPDSLLEKEDGNRFLAAFVRCLVDTRSKVVEFLSNLGEQAFATGEFTFSITEELYDTAPRLPNGHRYPMFVMEVPHMLWQLPGGTEYAMANALAATAGLNVDRGQIRFPVLVRLSIT